MLDFMAQNCETIVKYAILEINFQKSSEFIRNFLKIALKVPVNAFKLKINPEN